MATRGVLWTPGSAARGLVNWAIDLWPYVNGKSLFNKVVLEEMEVSEMLDVIHYLFEDDMRYSSGDEAKAQEKLRKELYKIYGREYKYGAGGSAPTYGGRAYVPSDGVDDFDVSPVNVKKPYVPPTDFNPESASPFGSVLDAPIG